MSLAMAPPPGAFRHAIIYPLDTVEWRDSGDPDKKHETTLRGHAAVFGRMSEDLGGFREIIEPGAFRAALRKQPDVRMLLNHDSNYVMARTASGTLELREDGTGLHVFARVDRRISWVEDLRTSMQRGDLDQMSFAFSLGDEGFDVTLGEDGVPLYTIRQDGVAELYDVSVVAYPAYPQTDVAMRSLHDLAVARGLLPGLEPPSAVGAGPDSHKGSGEARKSRVRGLQAKAEAARRTHLERTDPHGSEGKGSRL